jgi:hypothetical protein
VDCLGYLWNCRAGGSCIVRVAPDGVIDAVIEFPVLNPTSCTFGGENLQTLYITSAALGAPEHRFAGGLFAMDAGVRGLPENRFAAEPRHWAARTPENRVIGSGHHHLEWISPGGTLPFSK